jgi:hypothetical protein
MARARRNTGGRPKSYRSTGWQKTGFGPHRVWKKGVFSIDIEPDYRRNKHGRTYTSASYNLWAGHPGHRDTLDRLEGVAEFLGLFTSVSDAKRAGDQAMGNDPSERAGLVIVDLGQLAAVARNNMAGRPGKHGLPRYEGPRPAGLAKLTKKELKAWGSIEALAELEWRRLDKAMRSGMAAPSGRVAKRKPHGPQTTAFAPGFSAAPDVEKGQQVFRILLRGQALPSEKMPAGRYALNMERAAQLSHKLDPQTGERLRWGKKKQPQALAAKNPTKAATRRARKRAAAMTMCARCGSEPSWLGVPSGWPRDGDLFPLCGSHAMEHKEAGGTLYTLWGDDELDLPRHQQSTRTRRMTKQDRAEMRRNPKKKYLGSSMWDAGGGIGAAEYAVVKAKSPRRAKKRLGSEEIERVPRGLKAFVVEVADTSPRDPYDEWWEREDFTTVIYAKNLSAAELQAQADFGNEGVVVYELKPGQQASGIMN